MSLRGIIYLNLFLVLISSQVVVAREKEKEHVLDFEGEVIEGERKRPDMFLQMSNKEITDESLIFIRENFNDFHDVDQTVRPGYLKGKK